MKDYFIRLFHYNSTINQKIAQLIVAANSPDRSAQLMGHLLTAEQVWLRRLKGEYHVQANLWPDWKAADFAEIIESNYHLWINYLPGISNADFEKENTYQNLVGVEFTMKTIDMITQVTNHGTHTRAQIGFYLKQAGVEKLPITDYSFYINSL